MPSPASSPLKPTIAANIDRAIKAQGKTNRQVGDAIGATEHQVWRWRQGINEPTGPYKVALADQLFDGDIAALYAGEPQEAA